MAHSHSSSALSALKVAEENIRISLLNKSSSKTAIKNHSSKSSLTSSKELNKQLSKDMKIIQGYTRNSKIEKFANGNKTSEIPSYVDIIMKTTPIATGELISEDSFDNKTSSKKVYESIKSKSSSELRNRLKSDEYSANITKHTSNDGRMSQKFNTNQQLLNLNNKADSGLDSGLMSKTYYLPRKQDKSHLNVSKGIYKNSLKCYADTGSQDMTRTHLLSNLNNCRNWNKFYNASHKISMRTQSNK